MPQTREHLDILDLLAIPTASSSSRRPTSPSASGEPLMVADDVRALAGAETPYGGAPVVAGERKAPRTGLDELRKVLDGIAENLAPRARQPRRFHPACTSTVTSRCAGSGTVVKGHAVGGGRRRKGRMSGSSPASQTGRGCARYMCTTSASTSAMAGRRRRRLEPRGRGTGRGPARRRDPRCARRAGADPLRGRLGGCVAGSPATAARSEGAGPPWNAGCPRARRARSTGTRWLPGQRGFVQLRLEQPLVPSAGDRFVLRQVAPPDTLGGGCVLDPGARKHGQGGGACASPARVRERRPARRALRLELEASRSGVGPGGRGADLLAAARTSRATPPSPARARPRWFTPPAPWGACPAGG